MKFLLLSATSTAMTLLASCAPADLPKGGLSVSHPEGDGTCDAEPAQTFIGTRANDALASEILAETGSRTLRWAGPDTALTMDYRTDRVTVSYDEHGKITRIACG
ncbi:I78 family peptidase inhibitor [Qipengyuania nanhaisediminis]|uniref:I78 family peptidase inhibitor n=1 Tax=Qipengyuania nanhaisediminis TaxID=604088 RepID=UPI0038B3FB19